MQKADFELIGEKAEDLGIGEHKWYGKEDQTDDRSIHDKGQGEPVMIRLFEFKFKPGLDPLPTKEQLLTPEYIKQIQVQLWSDSLRLVMEPRIFIDKDGCKIFAPCVAATGSSFLEQPKLLQEWIK